MRGAGGRVNIYDTLYYILQNTAGLWEQSVALAHPHVLLRLKKGRKSKRERAGIELPYLFYIPHVVEDHAIDFLESVRPGSNYIDHQIWHLPGWGQFVLTFLGLHSL
jgi:hypothetical protein